MKIHFSKLHGTGNDLVVIEDWKGSIGDKLTANNISYICSRHFGVGADGLILIQKDKNADFTMVYFNSDGRPSSMCGNGGRCAAHWANRRQLAPIAGKLKAADGIHLYRCLENEVSLEMRPVLLAKKYESDFTMDTGSPHYIRFADYIPDDFINQAKAIRNHSDFIEDGINVNFIKIDNGALSMRTFERGVEDETLSCGTGVTAAALAYFQLHNLESNTIKVNTRGGELQVSYGTVNNDRFEDVYLQGPVKHVYNGTIEI